MSGAASGRRRARARRDEDWPEEGVEAQRWIVSYADFITLLFAFFVVMYSVSSVNQGKLRVLSDSLETVFSEAPALPVPIDLGGGMRGNDGVDEAGVEGAPLVEALAMESGEALLALDDLAARHHADFAATLEQALAEPVGSGQVKLRQSENWTEIELEGRFLFASGSARLGSQAEPIFARLVPLIQATGTPVRIEGYTDDVDPRGAVHGSNWELSAARAGSVAEALVRGGVDATRLSATGFGELHPVADNATAEGRRRNRRVVIAIARHAAVPAASVTLAAAADSAAEQLPLRTLRRVTELPGPEGISL